MPDNAVNVPHRARCKTGPQQPKSMSPAPGDWPKGAENVEASTIPISELFKNKSPHSIVPLGKAKPTSEQAVVTTHCRPREWTPLHVRLSANRYLAQMRCLPTKGKRESKSQPPADFVGPSPCVSEPATLFRLVFRGACLLGPSRDGATSKKRSPQLPLAQPDDMRTVSQVSRGLRFCDAQWCRTNNYGVLFRVIMFFSKRFHEKVSLLPRRIFFFNFSCYSFVFPTAVGLNVCVEVSTRSVLKRLVESRHILGNDLREAGVPKLSRTYSCFEDPFQNIPEPFEENWYNSIMRHFTSTSEIRNKNKTTKAPERGNIPNAERLRWEYFLSNRLLWKEASPKKRATLS